MMQIVRNEGQSLDFNLSYIVTTNFILLFDNSDEYKSKLQEISNLPEYGYEDSGSLYFDQSSNEFYFKKS